MFSDELPVGKTALQVLNETRDAGAIWYVFDGIHLEIGSTTHNDDGELECFTVPWTFRKCPMLYTMKGAHQRLAKHFLLSTAYGVRMCVVMLPM